MLGLVFKKTVDRFLVFYPLTCLRQAFYKYFDNKKRRAGQGQSPGLKPRIDSDLSQSVLSPPCPRPDLATIQAGSKCISPSWKTKPRFAVLTPWSKMTQVIQMSNGVSRHGQSLHGSPRSFVFSTSYSCRVRLVGLGCGLMTLSTSIEDLRPLYMRRLSTSRATIWATAWIKITS